MLGVILLLAVDDVQHWSVLVPYEIGASATIVYSHVTDEVTEKSFPSTLTRRHMSAC